MWLNYCRTPPRRPRNLRPAVRAPYADAWSELHGGLAQLLSTSTGILPWRPDRKLKICALQSSLTPRSRFNCCGATLDPTFRAFRHASIDHRAIESWRLGETCHTGVIYFYYSIIMETRDAVAAFSVLAQETRL